MLVAEQNAGSRPRCIGVIEGWARTEVGLSGPLQGVVAELAERVVAALEQLARQRQAGAVAADPLAGLQVGVVVGAAGPSGGRHRLVERSAQRRRPLPREVSGRAVLV